MTHSPLVVLVLLLTATAAPARDATVESPRAPLRLHTEQGALLQSSSTSDVWLRRESAGPDTFDLYGGPRGLVRDPDGIPNTGDEYVEGRFEDVTGTAARGLSPNDGDWTSKDLTYEPIYWQVSTFNAENLGGVGNRAMWCGLDAGDPRTLGWVSAPGYGNNWYQRVAFEVPVSDPGVGQTVDLDFVFNADTEFGYDFVYVDQITSFGIQTRVWSFDGSTAPFVAPGTRYSDLDSDPIVYAGGDYYEGDKIRIVLEFSSDGAYSDEDQFFDSDGAIQFDDVVVSTTDGTFTEDFEGPEPFLWEPVRQNFFGDFANVFAFTSDVDPCRENRSPQLNFVDRGQAPINGPGISGIASTGGITSPTVSYGTPEGYVVNYESGIGAPSPTVYLWNHVVSPEIEWDLPGPADDGDDVVGLRLDFDVWRDFPIANGIFYQWGVRFFANGAWTNFRDYGFVYGAGATSYLRSENESTEFVEPGVEKVQIMLGVIDISDVLLFPGFDATPAPWFDNVRLLKYRVGGPVLATRDLDIANDAFPVSGEIDTSTQAARDLLDVRFDMANDIVNGAVDPVPGDSITVNVSPVIPGTTVESARMVWALRQNPTFESALRAAPARPGLDSDFATGVAPGGRTIWSGAVALSQATTAGGAAIQDRTFADLPDADFLYPGDVLHYYVEATDSDGRVTTLPTDLSGFGVWDENGRSLYSRTWTMRALPSIDANGNRPDILLINDGGRRGQEEELIGAFEQNGYLEGIGFDSYTVQRASAGVGNGIGAAGAATSDIGERRGHGATLAQILDYGTIVYTSDVLFTALLTDGDSGPSRDLQLIQAWKDAPGRRASIWFGDSFASGMANANGAGATFVSNVLGVDVLDANLGSILATPTLVSVQDAGILSPVDFGVYGTCPFPRAFDRIRPLAGAVSTHSILDANGLAVPDAAGGVLFDRIVDGDRKVDVTFPFGMSSIIESVARSAGLGARARLLGAALIYAGTASPPTTPTDAPSRREPALAVAPTPFNPKTTVSFTLPRVGVQATVRVFDLRGQLVRTLHDGKAATADLRLDWDGRDASGAPVGSGVYLVRARTTAFDGSEKIVLVR